MKTFFSFFRYFLTLTFLASVGNALAHEQTVGFDASGWRFDTVGNGSYGYIRIQSGCCAWTTYTGALGVHAVSSENWSAVGRKVKFPAGLSVGGGSAQLWAKQPVFYPYGSY